MGRRSWEAGLRFGVGGLHRPVGRVIGHYLCDEHGAAQERLRSFMGGLPVW